MNFSAPVPAAAPAADDTTLIARYLAGDDHAFAPLLARHQSRVFTTLVLIVHDRALAEDLTQDTFIKAIKMLREGRYHDEGRFGAWVSRVAHNLAIDALRRLKLKGTISLDAPLGHGAPTDRPGHTLPTRVAFTADSTAPSPETLLIQAETRDHLRRLIEELPILQRQVLLMRHYGGMSFPEIAEATGVCVSTALARMRYALIKLRQRMLPPTATATGASLLLLTLLGANATTSTTAAPRGRGIRPDFFTYFIPEPDSDDPTFYSGNADPVRLQRPA